MFYFLWLGERKSEGIPLVKWKTMARPKNEGVWGLENIFIFSQALALKSLWRMFFDEGLWSFVIKGKYLKYLIVEQWIRTKTKPLRNISNV